MACILRRDGDNREAGDVMKKTKIILGVLFLAIGLVGCGKEKVEEVTEIEETSEEKTTETATKEEITTEATTQEETTEAVNPRNDILIALDPGHQGPNVDMSAKEPNAPGSSEMKTKATGGTTGQYTGVGEYQLNLDISLMVRDALEAKGYQVILTREDNDTAISNMERAELANNAGADVSIRIHANGSEDSSTNGALALIGSSDNAYVGSLYDESYALADCVLDEYCKSTGMKNQGIQPNDTMTGINWSRIPVMILEMGFMSNEQDDTNMQDSGYREKMVQGIVNGIERYYGFDKEETASSGLSETKTTNPDGGREDAELKAIVENLLQKERDKGTVASAYVKNLDTGEYVDLSEATHRSASVIKLFIAGCIYQNMEAVREQEEYDGEIERLISSMISASDNDATNTLVKKLGKGDASAGMQMVTDYAHSLGFYETQMGRLMLDFDADGENYTTVTETGAFLEMLYKGEVAGAEQILSYMKQQERTSKIPAGVPSGIAVANKTGELDDVEHDVAIIYGTNATYILCVMQSQLSDCAAGRETITEISSAVYDYWN